MTLAELLKELRDTGMTENTVRLCVNCYVMGMVNERTAIVKLAKADLNDCRVLLIEDIEARNNQEKPEGH